MRDQTIQTIENRILELFPAGHSYSRTQISNADFPSGVKHFLLSALQRRSEIEATELLNVRSEWFNADDKDYQKVLQQAVHTLGKSACFPASEWPKALHQAVDHVIEYLVSPISMLDRFVFSAESPSIPTTDLLRKASYFSDYPYLTRAVEAYIYRKTNLRIFKIDFVRALSRLDHQMTVQYESADWIKLLTPLIKLMGLPTPGVPVSFVIKFFVEKDRQDIGLFIERAASAKHAEMVSSDSLAALLTEALSPSIATKEEQKPPVNSEEAPTLEAPPASTTPHAAPPASTSSPDKSPKSSLPLWKKFKKTESESVKTEVKLAPEPLWKAFSRKNEENALKNKLNLEGAIPVKDIRPDVCAIVLGTATANKDRFVWQLFAGNHAAFDETMNSLAAAPDWTTASEIIAKKVFRPFKVDIYSSTAVDFTNAVESRYSGLRS